MEIEGLGMSFQTPFACFEHVKLRWTVGNIFNRSMLQGFDFESQSFKDPEKAAWRTKIDQLLGVYWKTLL